MDGNAWVASLPKKFGDSSKQARHPSLLNIGDKIWLAWLETHANNSKHVMSMNSQDGGKTWSDEIKLLHIDGKTDYPQLLKFKDIAYLVVNTSEGLKIKAL